MIFVSVSLAAIILEQTERASLKKACSTFVGWIGFALALFSVLYKLCRVYVAVVVVGLSCSRQFKTVFLNLVSWVRKLGNKTGQVNKTRIRRTAPARASRGIVE